MSYLLHVDQRERSVFNTYGFKCEYVIEQLVVGDYVITCGNRIKAVFERKTLKDYGASIKDGRTQNVEKLLDLRVKSGCDIYYIIEGPAFPSITTEYAGIPYRNIASSIRNLQVRYGINIIRTPSESGTAEELENIVHTYSTVEGAMEKPARFEWVRGESSIRAITNKGENYDITSLIDYFNGNINGAQLGEAFILNPEVHEYMTEIIIKTPYNTDFTAQQIQEYLTKKQEMPISSEAFNCFKSIAGFGDKTASLAIRYSMYHYMTVGVPNGLLASEKMRTLMDMRDINSSDGRENCIRWLSGISGISTQCAKSLCERSGYLRGIANANIEGLANIKVVKKLGSGQTNLGPALARKIREIIVYSSTIEPSSGSSLSPS